MHAFALHAYTQRNTCTHCTHTHTQRMQSQWRKRPDHCFKTETKIDEEDKTQIFSLFLPSYCMAAGVARLCFFFVCSCVCTFGQRRTDSAFETKTQRGKHRKSQRRYSYAHRRPDKMQYTRYGLWVMVP